MTAQPSYDHRWSRLRALMRERDVAALVISENSRTRYLTGYQRYFTATHVPPVHAVVLTRSGGPHLLVPRHIGLEPGEYRAERLIPLDFGEAARIEAIGRILHEDGAASGRVAIESSFLSHDAVGKLEAALPGTGFVDADPIMRVATAIKFPDEIALLCESARIVDIGVAAAVAACRIGVTELEVAAESSAAMLRSGAEFINHMTVRSGPHAYGNYPFPTARRLQDGDCVQIDIGCVYGGYVSDTNRTKIVGKASAEQLELLDVGQRMLEAGIAVAAPGAAASALWQAAVDVADRAGMRDRVILPFVGHGIGLTLHESPFINAAATTVLEEGMVFALEPGVYAQGIGCSRPEDMILVTASGAELLTHFPRDRDLNRGNA
ncbi:MAG: Xaa-Pro peptidase family protein [Burkholderiales bacterium]